MNAKTLEEELRNLQTARKNGDITAKEFYKALLNLILELGHLNTDEDENGENLRKKISFLLLVLKTNLKR